MLILIDPDLFVASLTDSGCEQMLDQVLDNLDRLRLALDDSKIIVNEYYKFLEKYIDTHINYSAIKLLQESLLSEEDITLPLPTHLSALRQNILQGYNYTTVEEKLLRMVANGKNLGVKLLLPGTGINAPLRDRKLNDPQVRRALLKKMPWLEVHFASNRKQIFAPPLIIHEKARTFEYMVAIKLQTLHPNLRCVETPEGVKNQLKKLEDVDLYVCVAHALRARAKWGDPFGLGWRM
jgi:hypothetical protein